MTTQHQAPEVTRPIIGIENRTAQEVFDIMCDRFTRATQPLSLTVDDETVAQVAAAIRFAINPLDGDPIGVMVHNYEFLQADGIEAQIALVDEVCAAMARAALDRLQSLSLPVDIDRSGLAQEVDDISYAGVK